MEANRMRRALARMLRDAQELAEKAEQSAGEAAALIYDAESINALGPHQGPPDEPRREPPADDDEPRRDEPRDDPPPRDRGERSRLSWLRELEWDGPVHERKPGPSADTVMLSPGDQPTPGSIVLGSRRTALKTPKGAADAGLDLYRVNVTSEDDTDWLGRLYGGRGKIRQCWIHDSNSKNEGHGFYLNVTGPLAITDCLFENLGGNALQIVFNYGKREDDDDGPGMDEGPPTDGGLILIEGCEFYNCGWNPARGSFCVAVYGGGNDKDTRDGELIMNEAHDLHFKDCIIEPGWLEPQQRGGKTVSSAGGVNARGYGSDHRDFGRITYENCTFRMDDPYQNQLQTGSCRELVVTGCTFEGGKIHIDPDWNKHKPSKSVTWEDNEGDSIVRHGAGPYRPVTDNWGGGELS